MELKSRGVHKLHWASARRNVPARTAHQHGGLQNGNYVLDTGPTLYLDVSLLPILLSLEHRRGHP